MSNTIHLPIDRKWFDMILSGEKKEEYRAGSDYYAVRLLHEIDLLLYRNSADPRWPEGRLDKIMQMTDLLRKDGKTQILFTNGYNPKRDPQLLIEWEGIEYKKPNPAWCPPDTEGLWFALKLGRIIETVNIEK